MAVSASDATWYLKDIPDWAPQQVLALDGRTDQLVVRSLVRHEITTTWTAAGRPAGLRLGEQVLLMPTAARSTAAPAAAAEPATATSGTISRIDGDRVWVTTAGTPQVNRPATVQRDGQVLGTLTWSRRDGVEWLGKWTASGPLRPRLGDRVDFSAGSPAPAPPPPTAPAVRPVRTVGDEQVIAGNEPIYKLMAALARRGFVPDTGRRQFDGESETVYSRREFVTFVMTMTKALLDQNQVWPIQRATSQDAALVKSLIDSLRPELRARGVNLEAVDAALAKLQPAGASWLLTAAAAGRAGSGYRHSTGRAEATFLGTALHDRLRVGLTLGTEGGKPFPAGRDRSDLAMYFAEYDLSRHFQFGVGRRSFRLGDGRGDLMWSDRIKPLDQVYYNWNTKFFGDPVKVNVYLGTLGATGVGSNARRYLATQHLEFLPTRRITLGMDLQLMADKSSQAFGSLFMPLYAVRFLAGNSSRGGAGNFQFALNGSYRFDQELLAYGQFFADDFDLSFGTRKTNRSLNRVGYLGGLYYTPQWALPGTQYRLESVLLPDPGTYVGQQEPELGLTRNGVLIGHEYGQDSAGFRLDLRHRLTPRFDVQAGYEYFRQLRSSPVSPTTTRLRLGTGYDLSRYFSLGLGLTSQRQTNLQGVQGDHKTDTSVYFQAQAGY